MPNQSELNNVWLCHIYVRKQKKIRVENIEATADCHSELSLNVHHIGIVVTATLLHLEFLTMMWDQITPGFDAAWQCSTFIGTGAMALSRTLKSPHQFQMKNILSMCRGWFQISSFIDDFMTDCRNIWSTIFVIPPPLASPLHFRQWKYASSADVGHGTAITLCRQIICTRVGISKQMSPRRS